MELIIAFILQTVHAMKVIENAQNIIPLLILKRVNVHQFPLVILNINALSKPKEH